MASEALFASVQLQFGFLLGPADGRYLVRERQHREPERILVLSTLGAPQRRLLRRRRPRRSDRPPVEPSPVPTARVTVIRAARFDAGAEAEAWLASLRRDGERIGSELAEAAWALNHLLRTHRAAAADPYTREVRPELALAARIGYGTGAEVADGRFAVALDVTPTPGRSRRTESLLPQERLAAILGGQDEALACEELILRARVDLDAARPREAALQARIALEALLAELDAEDLGPLRADVDADRRSVGEAANAALEGTPPEALQAAVSDAVERMEAAVRRRRLTRV